MAGGRTRSSPPRQARQRAGPDVPEPVDVVDGIPDRSGAPHRWKYAVLVLIFLGWVGFLIYCALAGAL